MPKTKNQHNTTAHGLDPIAFKPGSILRMDVTTFHLEKHWNWPKYEMILGKARIIADGNHKKIDFSFYRSQMPP